jgi:threonine/homoserine/homoserine lactone efflux protein
MAVDLELPIRGLVAGLIIAAPVGPVNLLCIRRTIEKGRKSGMVSGLGAALADTLYGAVAGFGISLVTQFITREEFWIRMIGGAFLTGVGVVYYCKPPRSLAAREDDSGANSDFASAFLLNVTNPTTVLSFLAVLATLGVGGQRSLWRTIALVVGIFCGSMIWWTLVASAASHLRSRLTDSSLRWMNHAAGIAIGGFGLANVLLSRGRRH